MNMADMNWGVLVPEIFLFVWALFVFTYDLGTKRRNPKELGYLTMSRVGHNRATAGYL